MKISIKTLSVLLVAVTFAVSCGPTEIPSQITDPIITTAPSDTANDTTESEVQSTTPPDKDDPSTDTTKNDTPATPPIVDEEANAGRFEGQTDIKVTLISGTAGAYTLENNVLKFTALKEDSVYSVSGKLNGNIVIDVGDDHKLDLELHGLSIVCSNTSPITVLSGDKISITAKKDYKNYIYDDRTAIDENAEDAHKGAIYSEVDLEICGKGKLYVVSAANNGIHSKDDLNVKNLGLYVNCADNALKGNDEIELESCNATLIARQGDAIKTSNTEISSKGNQKGSVIINGGSYYVFSASDGIDAAYDVQIDGNAELNVYTDKYSSYSEEVIAVTENVYYVRYTSKNYKYSIRYYNSEEDQTWVNAEYHSSVSGGRSTYYYYSIPKLTQYSKIQLYIYTSDMQQGTDTEYLAATDLMAQNDAYDTFAISSRGTSLSYQWTNYTTKINDAFGGGFGPGGMGRPGGGGFGDGNSDKSDVSTKGIKAGNEIVINSGIINIKAYDDAIHADDSTQLESGATPKGNVTVNGGNITVYSNDDGIHADGSLVINSGTVKITNSYEGIEGTSVTINGGSLAVNAKDDGINATATSGTGVDFVGGKVYIYCTGDGIDANSRSSYAGIVFGGTDVVVISNSSGNSAIDTEQGYTYNSGKVLAIMPQRGMTNEATHCKNFSAVGYNANVGLKEGDYLYIADNGKIEMEIKIPATLTAKVIYLGSNKVKADTSDTSANNHDEHGVYIAD